MMKKNKIEKNEMYVINQPKHLLLSIVLMDYEHYPLPEEIHNSLCRLSEVSDIIFVFSDEYFDNTGIHKDKITSLYQGCAFIDGKENLSRTIFKALLYDKEIFNKHIGITISRCQDLYGTSEKLFSNLEKINQSRVVKPIFNIYRLSSEEIYQFYCNLEEVGKRRLENCYLDFISNFICDPFLVSGKQEIDCRYCTWGSRSKVLYFRNTTINIFLEQLINQESEFYEFIDTFTDKDPRYLFSGLIKKNGIDCLDYNIEDLEVDKL